MVGLGASQITIVQAQTGYEPVQRGAKSDRSIPRRSIPTSRSIRQHRHAVCGYVDLGRVDRSLRQIAAEELDLEFGWHWASNDTFVTTNGFTAPPEHRNRRRRSVRRRPKHGGCLTPGVGRLEGARPDLTVAKGVVSVKSDARRSVTYGELLGDKRFSRRYEPVPFNNRGIEQPRTNPDVAPPKSRAAYSIVGSRIPRVDMPDKVSGKYQYMQHVRVPGMLHGRVVRPPEVGATLVRVDESSVNTMPGFVKIVVKKNFVGVVAEKPWQAMQMATQLKAEWTKGSGLPPQATFYQYLRDDKRSASSPGTRRRAGPTGRPRRVRVVPRAL